MNTNIYHEDCNCLFANNIRDNECIKRYYHVYDIDNNCFKHIIICNEHIRLLIKKEVVEKSQKNPFYLIDKVYTANNVIENIIGKYINLSSCMPIQSNDFLKRYISIEVCSRPYIWRNIKMADALEMALNGNSIIRKKVVEEIKEYIDNSFKKYKSKYNEVDRLCNQLKKVYLKEEVEIIVNEILVKLIELKIKSINPKNK